MKIISLQAENFKKLQAIEITPDGNFVQITGKNGQGKSSTLDAIWVALAGLDAAPKRPIRKGAESAKIHLDLGEIKVTRRFKETETGAFTTSLTVESSEGARYPSPQKMLDGLIGALAFDPVAFIAMEPKEQFNYCRRFVPNVDFEEFANLDRGDRQRRTEIGRLEEQERAAAMVIQVPKDTPEEEIDESALLAQLKAAGDANADMELRKANREKMTARIAELESTCVAIEKSVVAFEKSRNERRDREVREFSEEIRRLQERIEYAKSTAVSDIEAEYGSAAARVDEAQSHIAELRTKLDSAKPLPDRIDTEALVSQMSEARKTNENVRRLIERRKRISTADQLSYQYKVLTAAIKKREFDKQVAISAAQLPIEGLSFGDGIVLFREVPLDQASDAEKLRVSVALSMAANPKLKVVFIRNGSLLDEDGLRLVAEMAEQKDVQVWIERVASDGKVGIVLENGLVKETQE